jgi:hypothetical protein
MCPSDNQEYAKCPLCHGTGFSAPGTICRCISGCDGIAGGDDVLNFMKSVFGIRDDEISPKVQKTP